MATVFVTPAEGVSVPNIDAGEGVYFDPAGEYAELTSYVQRRIDDGSLIESEPSGPAAQDIIAMELDNYSRETITIASGAGVVISGTVIGQDEVTGKWLPSSMTATDGTETAGAVTLATVDASSSEGDQDVEALTGVSSVWADKLTYDASVDTDNEKGGKHDELRAAGIRVRER